MRTSSWFLSPVSSDLTMSIIQRKTPDAFETISVTSSKAWVGSSRVSCCMRGWRERLSWTYLSISLYVRSCRRSPGRPRKASSKSTQGRLDMHILTWDEFANMRLLKNSTIFSWSPSYSSRPSRKRQSFFDDVQAIWTQFGSLLQRLQGPFPMFVSTAS